MPATNGSRTSLSSQSTATKHGERRNPERNLPLESHHDAPRRRSGRLAINGPASAEFM